MIPKFFINRTIKKTEFTVFDNFTGIAIGTIKKSKGLFNGFKNIDLAAQDIYNKKIITKSQLDEIKFFNKNQKSLF